MNFDVIIFGATSFVGKLTARYLSTTYPDISLALAGRNEEKLSALRDALNRDLTLVVADAGDPADMTFLADHAKVIISTVGPYTLYGEHLIRACAENGTAYVNLCGEAPFIRRTIDRYQAKAAETGARIVHSCGFDSVPSDMGMFALARAAGEEFQRVQMVVTDLKGGLSGGTIASMKAALEDQNGEDALHGKYSLCPDPHDEANMDGQKDMAVERTPEGWAGPFFMASFNTRIVRRSNSLLGHTYGYRLRYTERQKTGSKLAAYALTGAIGVAFKAATTNGPWQRLIPAPGTGPSEKAQEAGHFTTVHHGLTVSGKHWATTFHGNQDPGYKGTAKFLGEAAMTLITHPDHTAGGILTPATGLGEPYLERLRAAGFEISTRCII
ncbi:saccharopine dehydrogenase family protein [Corynebacterium pyruviciproducens]|uniref:Saccharopine dehydrogenase NADP-binding domain-containing protein n=1 Tax=Corynebacterium pyruviciproducens TaxID=598660 RepID=A0AAF1BS10_9CORY|nr:saccharopine dehydrogenase NADP-binding domain-containing protein [Corynebacterium pyruviciproducens]MDK6565025.1 saccharopine dehydrogenase NADP-binding domain-containing protein [Corynebacterium pyruviciproducens]WOT02328.1 saccharopine dehydrogenase NADP-binding domain-containing protein [Corynebacterium pyruviciproducens]